MNPWLQWLTLLAGYQVPAGLRPQTSLEVPNGTWPNWGNWAPSQPSWQPPPMQPLAAPSSMPVAAPNPMPSMPAPEAPPPMPAAAPLPQMLGGFPVPEGLRPQTSLEVPNGTMPPPASSWSAPAATPSSDPPLVQMLGSMGLPQEMLDKARSRF